MDLVRLVKFLQSVCFLNTQYQLALNFNLESLAGRLSG